MTKISGNSYLIHIHYFMLDITVIGVANSRWISTKKIVKITAIGRIVMRMVVGISFWIEYEMEWWSFFLVFFFFSLPLSLSLLD